jgi:hypothetical protein
MHESGVVGDDEFGLSNQRCRLQEVKPATSVVCLQPG